MGLCVIGMFLVMRLVPGRHEAAALHRAGRVRSPVVYEPISQMRRPVRALFGEQVAIPEDRRPGLLKPSTASDYDTRSSQNVGRLRPAVVTRQHAHELPARPGRTPGGRIASSTISCCSRLAA